MLESVSDAKTSIANRAERAAQKQPVSKTKLKSFHYFAIASGVVIAVMWGLNILWPLATPERTTKFARNDQVLLVSVDNALKRYAHYEGKGYPIKLTQLIPKYLSLKDSERHLLEKITYQLDPEDGYRLSLARTKKGEEKAVFSENGVELVSSRRGGAK
jgi:hypothetical protein